MSNSFSFSMQVNPFPNETINEELINQALDYIFEDAILGNFNYFLLSNSSSFIQTIFQDVSWHIEVFYIEGELYETNTLDDSHVITFFNNFLRGSIIDVSTFKKIVI